MVPPPQNDTKFKIFIGGTTPDTDEEVLRTHFEQYGTIVDCVVMKHPQTNRPRGFGFVSFTNQEEVDHCMSERPHTLKGRQVEVKRAMPRDISSQSPENNITVKKLFLGGLKDAHNDENLKEYFTQYGKIESVDIVKDPQTGRMRGFGFLTFEDYDSVDRCILVKNHVVNNASLDTKKALPKEQQHSGGQSSRGRGGMRGGGGFGDRGGRGRGGFGRGGGQNQWNQNGGNYGGSGGGYPQSQNYGNSNYSGPGGDFSQGQSSNYSNPAPQGNWNQAAYQTSSYGQNQTPAWDSSQSSQYGQNYSQNYSGGPMKNPNAYNQRAPGPYGSGYGGSASYSYGNGSSGGVPPVAGGVAPPSGGGYQPAVGGASQQQTSYSSPAYNSNSGSYQ